MCFIQQHDISCNIHLQRAIAETENSETYCTHEMETTLAKQLRSTRLWKEALYYSSETISCILNNFDLFYLNILDGVIKRCLES